MLNIEGYGFSEIYKKVCVNLLEKGNEISPRGMKTKEINGVIIKIQNPRTRILNSNLRKISLAFAIGEWLWCLSGREDLEMIQYYAPSYYKYSDDGLILNGAYGPRIKNSLDKIINLLKSDKDTRRAVIPIYSKEDAGKKSNDIPCTLSLQLFIRNNKLDMYTSMRSNDVFLGLPYDVFNFTMWQEYIACRLGVNLGTYTHMVSSIHVYEKDVCKLQHIINLKEVKENIMLNMPKENIEEQVKNLIKMEENIRKGFIYNKKLISNYFQLLVEELERYHNR